MNYREPQVANDGLPDVSAERGLWCAVLQHALNDAVKVVNRALGKKPEERAAKIQCEDFSARMWREVDVRYVTEESRSLKDVCSFAGMEADVFVEGARALIKRETGWESLI